jgi:hypothetical protein
MIKGLNNRYSLSASVTSLKNKAYSNCGMNTLLSVIIVYHQLLISIKKKLIKHLRPCYPCISGGLWNVPAVGGRALAWGRGASAGRPRRGQRAGVGGSCTAAPQHPAQPPGSGPDTPAEEGSGSGSSLQQHKFQTYSHVELKKRLKIVLHFL